jgi:hypothetical protein
MVYRRPDHALAARLEDLHAERARAVASLPRTAVEAFARRASSIAAGAAASACGLSMLAAGYAGLVGGELCGIDWDSHARLIGLAPWLLLAGIVVFPLTTVIVRPLARVWLTRLLRAAPRGDADIEAYVARLHDARPAHVLQRKAMRLETASVALPLVASCLLAPLALFYVLLYLASMVHHASTDDFAWTIQAVVMLAGHAHLVLAGCAIGYARRLRRGAVTSRGHALSHALAGVLLAGVASVLPGLAIGFPYSSLFILVTGAIVVPLAYDVAFRRVTEERETLASACA